MSIYPELEGKVAVISGASGNLGAAVVRGSASQKVRLALIDRHEDHLRKTLHDVDLSNVPIGAVDLTKKAEVDAFMDSVLAHYGQVDMLINTTGGYKPGKAVHEMDEAQWD